jgi:hypothetical protein
MKRTRQTAIHTAAALEVIRDHIFALRGQRVILDKDLAELYGVPLKRLNEQVKRNRRRFPGDFMFRLTMKEVAAASFPSRSQIATLNRGHNLKYTPHAFTEHGAIMLATVLKSPLAIDASLQVVRAFVQFRHLLGSSEDLRRIVEALARRVGKHDQDLKSVVRTLRQLLELRPTRKRAIGFGK